MADDPVVLPADDRHHGADAGVRDADEPQHRNATAGVGAAVHGGPERRRCGIRPRRLGLQRRGAVRPRGVYGDLRRGRTAAVRHGAGGGIGRRAEGEKRAAHRRRQQRRDVSGVRLLAGDRRQRPVGAGHHRQRGPGQRDGGHRAAGVVGAAGAGGAERRRRLAHLQQLLQAYGEGHRGGGEHLRRRRSVAAHRPAQRPE